MPIYVSYTIDDRYFVSARAWRRAMVKAHQHIGEIFHKEMLPERFKKGADSKFKYKVRTARYLKWKRRKWESRRPLKNGQYVEGSGTTTNVLSGDMRDQMKSDKLIRAFPTRTSVTMSGPRYMTMISNSNQPDKLHEILTLTPAEESRLAEEMDKVLEREAA